MMTRRGAGVAIGLAAGLVGLSGWGAQAGCLRSLVNRSALTALVSHDGGPWVRVPPHRTGTIRYAQSGRIEVALVCDPAAPPEGAVYRDAFDTSAIIDRCYVRFGDGLFEDQLGPGFFGTRDSKPLTLNVPRQGDVVVGPAVEARCPVFPRESLRARY